MPDRPDLPSDLSEAFASAGLTPRALQCPAPWVKALAVLSDDSEVRVASDGGGLWFATRSVVVEVGRERREVVMSDLRCSPHTRGTNSMRTLTRWLKAQAAHEAKIVASES